jgi:chemotaxis protein CheY-P-specific phosphatase CheC
VKRFGELEESTIAETANIALNGALNAIAREDGVRFHPGVPDVEHRVKDLAAYLAPDGRAEHVVVVETGFREPTRDIRGTLVVLLALE